MKKANRKKSDGLHTQKLGGLISGWMASNQFTEADFKPKPTSAQINSLAEYFQANAAPSSSARQLPKARAEAKSLLDKIVRGSFTVKTETGVLPPFIVESVDEEGNKSHEFDLRGWLDYAEVKGLYKTEEPGLYYAVKDQVVYPVTWHRGFGGWRAAMMELIDTVDLFAQKERALIYKLLREGLSVLPMFDRRRLNTDTDKSTFIHYEDITQEISARGVKNLKERPGYIMRAQIIPHPAPHGKPGRSIVEEKMRETMEEPEKFQRVFGYLIHRKKKRYESLHPVFYGRGGNFKGLLIAQGLGHVRAVHVESVKAWTPDNKFVFGSIPPWADLVIFDECPPGFEEALTSFVTDMIKHESKSIQHTTWDFRKVPKGCSITNFVFNLVKDKYILRRHPHFKMKQVKKTGRSIFGGRDIFDDFTPKEWSNYYHFVNRCVVAYFKKPTIQDFVGVTSDLALNIMRQKTRRTVGEAVEHFAVNTVGADWRYGDIKNPVRFRVDEVNERLGVERGSASVVDQFIYWFELITGLKLRKQRDKGDVWWYVGEKTD